MQVAREGLYYRLNCRCQFSDKGFYRVIINHDGGAVDLGICVPQGDKYYITKKVAAKNLNGDSWQVVALRDEESANGLEIDPNSGFSYISRLHELYYISPFLYFKEKSPNQRDSGQSP